MISQADLAKHMLNGYSEEEVFAAVVAMDHLNSVGGINIDGLEPNSIEYEEAMKKVVEYMQDLLDDKDRQKLKEKLDEFYEK